MGIQFKLAFEGKGAGGIVMVLTVCFLPKSNVCIPPMVAWEEAGWQIWRVDDEELKCKGCALKNHYSVCAVDALFVIFLAALNYCPPSGGEPSGLSKGHSDPPLWLGPTPPPHYG